MQSQYSGDRVKTIRSSRTAFAIWDLVSRQKQQKEQMNKQKGKKMNQDREHFYTKNIVKGMSIEPNCNMDSLPWLIEFHFNSQKHDVSGGPVQLCGRKALYFLWSLRNIRNGSCVFNSSLVNPLVLEHPKLELLGLQEGNWVTTCTFLMFQESQELNWISPRLICRVNLHLHLKLDRNPSESLPQSSLFVHEWL